MTLAKPSIPATSLDAFIAALEGGSSVTEACQVAHIGRRTAYDYRASDHAFSERWDDALEARADKLEKEANARALDRDDPNSARLLQFLLKGYRRGTFGDKVEVDAKIEAVTSRELAAARAAAEANPEATRAYVETLALGLTE